MRFLIVDDDPACRELLRAILSPYADCDLAFDGSGTFDHPAEHLFGGASVPLGIGPNPSLTFPVQLRPL